MKKIFLLSLIVMTGASLIAMDATKVAFKPVAKDYLATHAIAELRKVAELGDWDKVTAIIREFPEAINATLPTFDGTALHCLIDGAFNRAQINNKTHFDLFILFIMSGASLHQQISGKTLKQWIGACANYIIHDDSENADHWRAVERRWLDCLEAAGEIFFLEARKKQFFGERCNNLADFENLWHERQEFFALQLAKDTYTADALLDKYPEVAKDIDRIFINIIGTRVSRGVPNLKIYGVIEPIKGWMKYMEARLRDQFGTRKNFEDSLQNFYYQIDQAIGQQCQIAKPDTAEKFYELFTTYVQDIALPEFKRHLEATTGEEKVELLFALAQKERDVLHAAVNARDAEIRVLFARKRLEKLREELRKLDNE